MEGALSSEDQAGEDTNGAANLPFEVWDHILSYNDHTDTQVVAQCCRGLFTLLKPLIWKNVTVNYPRCGSLEREEGYLQNLKHTEKITFSNSIYFKGNPEGDKEENLFEFAAHLGRFLSHVSSGKLRKLEMDAIAPDSCFRFIIQKLRFVRELKVQYKDKGSYWSSLENLQNLHALTLNSCGLRDEDLENILSRNKLSTLVIKRCKYLTDKCLATMDKIASLESLTLNYNGYKIVTKPLFVYTLIGLHKVTELDLSHIRFTDDAMSSLCVQLRSLERLKLSCLLISDEGLKSLHCLTELTKLDIVQCPRLTGETFLHIERVHSLKAFLFDVGLCCIKNAIPFLMHSEIRETLRKLNNIQSLNNIHIRRDITQIDDSGFRRMGNIEIPEQHQDSALGVILQVLCDSPKWGLKMMKRIPGIREYVLYKIR